MYVYFLFKIWRALWQFYVYEKWLSYPVCTREEGVEGIFHKIQFREHCVIGGNDNAN